MHAPHTDSGLRGLLALLTVFALAACGSDDSPLGPADAVDDPGAEAINAYFETVPDWDQPASASDRAIAGPTRKTYSNTSDPIPDWRCDATTWEMVTRTNRIFAPETDFGVIWPGAVLQGESVKSGEPRAVVVERAPLTIFTNLTVTPNSIEVESPSAVTVNGAIAQLVAGAGDSYKSSWNFVAQEITTNKQGSMTLGLNAGYAEQASGAVDFDASRSLSKRVFAGRALEEMFTIRFADDHLATPADLFGDSVSPQDLADAGITDRDAPVYVRSITYGRMVVFTAEVRGEDVSNDMGGALNAMFEGVEGGGSVGASDRELLGNATYNAQGYGPNAGDALGALQDVELERFFSPTTADKAVPLFFEIVTVKDKDVAANVGERTTYEVTENCQQATGYELTTTFERVRAKSDGVVASRSYKVVAVCNLLDAVIPHTMATLPMPLPDGGQWVNLDKSSTCRLTTWTLGSALLQAQAVGDLEFDEWRSAYPYVALPRSGSASWRASTKILDSGWFFAERTIEYDVSMKLTPVFD